MITTSIDVTTKQGHKQTTTWAIVQNRPYPSVEAKYGSPRWSNCGGLLPDCNGTVNGLGEEYTCYLLRSDRTEWDIASREAYAGYTPYASSREKTPPANPGFIVLRGVDMGEMSIELRLHAAYDNVHVRGFGNPTTGERAFIANQIIPALRAAINAHKDALKVETLVALRAHVAERLAETRKAVDQMEQEMKAAINAL